MKITIGKNEIEEAVECYLSKKGLDLEQYDLDIKMIVGRTDDARIEIDLNQGKEESNDVVDELVPRVETPSAPFGLSGSEE